MAKGEKVKINSKPSPQPSDESGMYSSDDFSDEEANQLVSEMDKQSSRTREKPRHSYLQKK
jgi:hypothetical protein